jgi:hypothetical protein
MGFRLAFVRLFNRKTLKRFASELDQPQKAQSRRLAELLAIEANAGYFKEHGGTASMGVDAFRATLPISDYDTLWPYIEPLVERGNVGAHGTVTAQHVSMFLKTSGTTGRPKLLPVTPEYEAETDRGRRVWIERMLAENEQNSIGAHMTIVSPAQESRTRGGLPVGSNTGRIFMRQPEWLRLFSAAPYDACGLTDFDLRYYAILRHAIAKPDVGTLTTANPSTVLLLCRKILELGDELADAIEKGAFGRPLDQAGVVPLWDQAAVASSLRKGLEPDAKRAAAVRRAVAQGADGLLGRLWPQLTTVNCWLGGHAPVYLERLRPFLGDIPVRDPGFSASEGLFAIPVLSGTPEGVLHNSGPFMEFVPEGEGTDHTLLSHELEIGGRYRLIVTTGGGLWRYDMKDVIEVTGRMGATPLVRFLYKAGGALSVTGEKVTEEHAVAAAMALAKAHGANEVCATLELTDPPRYVVTVEGGEGGAETLAKAWEAAMKAANLEYAEKRGSGRLAPATVRRVPAGAFAAWRRRKVEAGAPDGQVKLPPLVPDLDALERGPLFGIDRE